MGAVVRVLHSTSAPGSLSGPLKPTLALALISRRDAASLAFQVASQNVIARRLFPSWFTEIASSVNHVDPGDPPLLLFHGDQDPQVPINQSHELHGAYKRTGLPVTFFVVHGAAHGGPEFFEPEPLREAISFLRQTLMP